MRRAGRMLLVIAFGVMIGFSLANRWKVRGQARVGSGFAAVPGEVGGWDLTGPYDVVKDWRQKDFPSGACLSGTKFGRGGPE